MNKHDLKQGLIAYLHNLARTKIEDINSETVRKDLFDAALAAFVPLKNDIDADFIPAFHALMLMPDREGSMASLFLRDVARLSARAETVIHDAEKSLVLPANTQITTTLGWVAAPGLQPYTNGFGDNGKPEDEGCYLGSVFAQQAGQCAWTGKNGNRFCGEDVAAQTYPEDTFEGRLSKAQSHVYCPAHLNKSLMPKPLPHLA